MIRKVTAVSQPATPVETTETQTPTPVVAAETTTVETTVETTPITTGITNKNTENKGDVKMSTPTPITGGIANLTKEQRKEMMDKAKLVMEEKKAKGQVNYAATSVSQAADILRDTTLNKTFKVKGHEIAVKSNIIEIIDKYRNADPEKVPVTKDDLSRILELAAAAIIDYAIEGHGVKLQGAKSNVTFTIKNVYGKGIKHSVAALIQKPGRFLSSDKVRLTTEEFEG
jgi:hypothetical protein